MIRIVVGRDPYDIRLFLVKEAAERGGDETETELPLADLKLSGLSFRLESNSSRVLILETEVYTFDGLVDEKDVSRLEHFRNLVPKLAAESHTEVPVQRVDGDEQC